MRNEVSQPSLMKLCQNFLETSNLWLKENLQGRWIVRVFCGTKAARLTPLISKFRSIVRLTYDDKIFAAI